MKSLPSKKKSMIKNIANGLYIVFSIVSLAVCIWMAVSVLAVKSASTTENQLDKWNYFYVITGYNGKD